jgi:hypothetical protein
MVYFLTVFTAISANYPVSYVPRNVVICFLYGIITINLINCTFNLQRFYAEEKVDIMFIFSDSRTYMWLWMLASSGMFFLGFLGGVRLSPLGTSATVGLLYQPRMIDDDYGAVGGMRIGRGNRSTRRKPDPVPLCPPQIPHYLTSNSGRRGGKPAANRLSHGTSSLGCYTKYYFRSLQIFRSNLIPPSSE